MSFTNLILIAGGVILLGIVAFVAFYVLGAILTAWEYAKSPSAQMAKELEDNGCVEVNGMAVRACSER